MSVRQLAWRLVPLLALVIVPLAAGTSMTVNATGVIEGTGTSYKLTITNTGTEPIKCMQLLVAAGVRVGTVTPPGGWAASIDPSTRARFGAQSQAGIPPGGSAMFSFTTEAPYPEGAGGELHVSANCQTDVVVKATGPGGGGAKKCNCVALAVKVDPTLIKKKNVPADKQDFGVGFTWTMTCDAGQGGCKGRVDFLPPKILAGSLPKPPANFKLNIKRATVNCLGQCAKTQSGRFEIKMKSTDQLNVLFGRTLAFQLKLWCVSANGQLVSKGTRTIKVRVDQKGRLRPV